MSPAETKRVLKAFHKKAKVIVDRIGKDRDELRTLVEDYTDILQTVDDAHEGFDSALDTLSQLL